MRGCIIFLLCLTYFHAGHGFSLNPLDYIPSSLNPTDYIKQMMEGATAVCKMAMPKAWSTKDISPTVHVYTRGNYMKYKIGTQLDTVAAANLMAKDGYLAEGRQVVFIVHGYMNLKSGIFPWMDELKDAILNRQVAEDSTVIIVSWGTGALQFSYNQAGANTQPVAFLVSSLAEAILNTDTFKGNPNNAYLYCIGHSLGAQICGQAGRLSGNFDRVTGLDPAGPGFEDCWTKLHIDTDSADCVDNIHTDGLWYGHVDPLVSHYGTILPWGHIDFYPNGGRAQVGCSFLTNDFPACSHMKAIEFFIYSLKNKGECTARGVCKDPKSLPDSCDKSDTQLMGYYSTCHKEQKEVKKGNYYLTTTTNPAICAE